ncbi:MAG: nucleoside deaminase [Synergistaceae bacterium]|nr:nucleoside deaminase [Synergistaceae bacterium]
MLLEIIRDEILPLTESESTRGNLPSGSALLRADTLTSVMVGADNRVVNPLFHGDIDAINRFFKLPVRPKTNELIFLATHDPCPMCASAIAWAGFKELWVFFDRSNWEHDQTPRVERSMYRDLFGVDDIRQDNPFFTRHSIRKTVATNPHREELQRMIDEIERRYAALKRD